MIDKIRSHLGLKFFILQAVVIVMSIAPLTYMAAKAINGYGHVAVEMNETQIRSQVSSSLREIARERAGRYEAVFDRIAVSAGMLGAQASALYSNRPFYASRPYKNFQFDLPSENGILGISNTDPAVFFYRAGSTLRGSIKEEMSALSHLTPLFIRTLDENPEALVSHLISASGIGQYCTEDSQAKGNLFKLAPVAGLDAGEGESMTDYTKIRGNSREVRWTNIYRDDVIHGLMLTANAPIYDDKGSFCGVTGIDVPIHNVVDDILYFWKSRWSDEMVLFSFLLDGTGRVIAIPQSYYPLFGLSNDNAVLINSGGSLELSLLDSAKSEVREFGRNLLEREDTFFRLQEGTESYLIATHKMGEPNWFLGIVVRENDILTAVRASGVVLKNTVRDIQLRSILIGVVIACLAIVIVFDRVKRMVSPLKNLAGATRRVAGGDLTVHCPVSTSDEVGKLADSFNTMVDRLQLAQKQQKRYADTLEIEVERRNIELGDKKIELEKTIKQLDKEVERRQIISEALKNSQQQYVDTLEASMAGAYIIENGIFTYVNNSLAEIFHTTRKEMIGLKPVDLVFEEDRPVLMANTRLRLQGHEVSPYTVKWVRNDGTNFYGEVWGKIALWQKKRVMVGTLNDVTSIKLKEELLKIQDRRLQKSLDEKEVLLKEIYHRTKNNMLVIISLLDLQVKDIEDERARQIFRETENRIRAMALVHEKLYQSQNLSEIDLGQYLEEIIESLISTMVAGNRVRFVSDIESIVINIDYAIPLGLVVNEIVTNSIKYAFPDGRSGLISLKIAKLETRDITLDIRDDGIGLPGDIDVEKSSSFGMRIIITNLVKMQLRGTLTICRENGTEYRICFPEPQPTKRI
jgi:PAS domain S-box-containing protein